mmetsp:Transcript_10720/g.26767  ORF Transcript_10720/g.26767 Transcript_10720/m.26767 type:complete len:228 (+) Transcript_10720:276-959(+)
MSPDPQRAVGQGAAPKQAGLHAVHEDEARHEGAVALEGVDQFHVVGVHIDGPGLPAHPHVLADGTKGAKGLIKSDLPSAFTGGTADRPLLHPPVVTRGPHTSASDHQADDASLVRLLHRLYPLAVCAPPEADGLVVAATPQSRADPKETPDPVAVPEQRITPPDLHLVRQGNGAIGPAAAFLHMPTSYGEVVRRGPHIDPPRGSVGDAEGQDIACMSSAECAQQLAC